MRLHQALHEAQTALHLPLLVAHHPAGKLVRALQHDARHCGMHQLVHQLVQAELCVAVQVNVLDEAKGALHQVVGVRHEVQHLHPPVPGPVLRIALPVLAHVLHHAGVSGVGGAPVLQLHACRTAVSCLRYKAYLQRPLPPRPAGAPLL